MNASTSTPRAAGTRFASPDQTGAALYNAYHFITQLAGLYAEAMHSDARKGGAILWHELSDLTLADIGDVYQAWEAILQQSKSASTTEDAVLGQAVITACTRLNRASQLLNSWSSIDRWGRLLSICERKWGRLLQRFQQQYAPKQADPRLAYLQRGSADRMERLTSITEALRKERVARNAQYVVTEKVLRKGEAA